MCIADLFNFLIVKKTLTVAYPEEIKGQNISSDPAYLKYLWAEKYQVKDKAWGLSLQVIFDDTITNPAWTITDVIYIQSQFANPGVLAHEAAHVSYSLLTDKGKADFEIKFNLLSSDPKIILLKNMGKLSNMIENHAEIYRYWGNQMPGTLKQFYPKLF